MYNTTLLEEFEDDGTGTVDTQAKFDTARTEATSSSEDEGDEKTKARETEAEEVTPDENESWSDDRN